jgi:fructokinase
MRIGVDLGGSKIETIVLGDDGDVLLRERVATPQGDYAATLAAVAGLVVAAAEKVGAGDTAIPIGIGIPGAESRVTGLVKNANSTCLIGKPLKRDLEELLRREVRIANDANCFALSEAVDGAGAGASVGVRRDPRHRGRRRHRHRRQGADRRQCDRRRVGAQPDARRTPQGRLLLRAQGLHRAFSFRPGHGCRSSPSVGKLAGADFQAIDIAGHAANGDTQCEATLQRYESRLARALAQVINILDPDVIVLGGGLSNMDRLYQNVPRLWGEYVFSDRVATRLLKHRHGDSSGVRGAAWLWS